MRAVVTAPVRTADRLVFVIFGRALAVVVIVSGAGGVAMRARAALLSLAPSSFDVASKDVA